MHTNEHDLLLASDDSWTPWLPLIIIHSYFYGRIVKMTYLDVSISSLHDF